jgi:hypothetical protein
VSSPYSGAVATEKQLASSKRPQFLFNIAAICKQDYWEQNLNDLYRSRTLC